MLLDFHTGFSGDLRPYWWPGSPISLRIFCSLLSTVKIFSLVNEPEIDVFLEFPCFLHDRQMLVLSDFSAFSKSILYIWKFLVHILLKPSLKSLGHYLVSMWNESNCKVVWMFFDTSLTRVSFFFFSLLCHCYHKEKSEANSFFMSLVT